MLKITTSRTFNDWLKAAGGSIALSSSQAGKVILLGLSSGDELSVFERSFQRPRGLYASPDGQTVVVTTLYQVYRFENALPPDQMIEGRDAVYVPQIAWTTGDLDIHDVAPGTGGMPLFVNTLFSCIASVSERFSFTPLWRPAFISHLAPEDRCHLNGFAVEDGVARYATSVSRADVSDGWRDQRFDGGVLLNVKTGDVVVEGLSMPHSPRFHGGRLWLLNSGAGEFGWVDPGAREFRPVAFCPGFGRGLAFTRSHAVVGLSMPREDAAFQGLQLDAGLRSRSAEPRCGLIILNPSNGDTIAWVRFQGALREVDDVTFLPGIRNPTLVGLNGKEIQRIISIDPSA